jgi:hypothetical protein
MTLSKQSTPKAMPVVLTMAAEIDQRIMAPADDAMRLQHRLPNEVLNIVATGERKDECKVG